MKRIIVIFMLLVLTWSLWGEKNLTIKTPDLSAVFYDDYQKCCGIYNVNFNGQSYLRCNFAVVCLMNQKRRIYYNEKASAVYKLIDNCVEYTKSVSDKTGRKILLVTRKVTYKDNKIIAQVTLTPQIDIPMAPLGKWFNDKFMFWEKKLAGAQISGVERQKGTTINSVVKVPYEPGAWGFAHKMLSRCQIATPAATIALEVSENVDIEVVHYRKSEYVMLYLYPERRFSSLPAGTPITYTYTFTFHKK